MWLSVAKTIEKVNSPCESCVMINSHMFVWRVGKISICTYNCTQHRHTQIRAASHRSVSCSSNQVSHAISLLRTYLFALRDANVCVLFSGCDERGIRNGYKMKCDVRFTCLHTNCWKLVDFRSCMSFFSLFLSLSLSFGGEFTDCQNM